MKPLVVNHICMKLIEYRDGISSHEDRELLADACDALDGYAKALRALRAARQFINDDSPDWRFAKQEILSTIDAELGAPQ